MKVEAITLQYPQMSDSISDTPLPSCNRIMIRVDQKTNVTYKSPLETSYKYSVRLLILSWVRKRCPQQKFLTLYYQTIR